jgi:Ca2+-dependent lipid-binding protein
MDSSDPYLVLKTIDDQVLYKGEYVKKNLNPKWETFEVRVCVCVCVCVCARVRVMCVCVCVCLYV